MPRRAFLTTLIVTALAASPLAGQEAPPRPRLRARADTNSWEAYFRHGVPYLATQPSVASAAFHWASRVDPERPEPLFAAWVAFHLRDYHRWVDDLNGELRAVSDPAVIAADSLRIRALIRNPFVPQTLAMILYNELPGVWLDDDLTRGWHAYAAADFAAATELLSRGVQRDPDKYAFARELLAQAFVARQAYDSALMQLVELKRALDRRTEKRLARYRSREMIEYAIGMLEYARGRRAAGDTAMMRALVENLGFWPAHFMLGDAAAAHGELATALAEYDRAFELEPNDVILLRHYASALVRADRAADALPLLRRAVTLEPAYARPWYGLGVVMERLGDAAGAKDAYRRYIRLAPRDAVEQVKAARARIAALGG